MADSNAFSSLLALVDSHLSKINVQESHSKDIGWIHQTQIQGLAVKEHSTQLESGLFSPNQKLRIPSFYFTNSNSPVTNILAEQVTNMLKATELKNQNKAEEKKRVEESKHTQKYKFKLEEDYNLQSMDFMQVLKRSTKNTPNQKYTKSYVIKSSGSLESLNAPTFLYSKRTSHENIATSVPLLPCLVDRSYNILYKKTKKAKCSAFGKVLTAKVRPVVIPYLGKQIR